MNSALLEKYEDYLLNEDEYMRIVNLIERAGVIDFDRRDDAHSESTLSLYDVSAKAVDLFVKDANKCDADVLDLFKQYCYDDYDPLDYKINFDKRTITIFMNVA